jgi:hypothetical protein
LSIMIVFLCFTSVVLSIVIVVLCFTSVVLSIVIVVCASLMLFCLS